MDPRHAPRTAPSDRERPTFSRSEARLGRGRERIARPAVADLAFRPRRAKRHGMRFELSRKTKGAQEQAKGAQAQTKGAQEQAKGAQEQAKGAQEQAKAAAGKVPGAGKVQRLLGDFDAAVPVLRDLGYALSDVTIKLGMPPSLGATFQLTREASDEEVTAALRENRGKKLVAILIRMLSKAQKFQSGVRVGGLKAKSTTVEIGLMGAGVSVKFA
jgi:hypothetical protein